MTVCKIIWHLTNLPYLVSTLAADKVSILTHRPTCPTNPWGALKWSYAITRLTAHFTSDLMSDLVTCKFRKICSYMTPNVLTETQTQRLIWSPRFFSQCSNQSSTHTSQRLWQINYTLNPARFPRIEGESGNVSEHHTSRSSWHRSRTEMQTLKSVTRFQFTAL